MVCSGPLNLEGAALSRVASFLLPALLVGSLALNLWSIDFGQPATYDQCVDPVLPVLSLDAVDNVLGERNIGGIKYPRLHFIVIGAAQRAWFRVRYGAEGSQERLDPLMHEFYEGTAPDRVARRRDFRSHGDVISELIIVGRVLSAIMGMLCVLAIYLFTRELISRSAGWMAAGFVGASYPFVYYAHTCNVDVPYLMWGMLAFYAAVRAVRTGRVVWIFAAGILAALSTGTKDQAGAWFLLAVPALLWLMRYGLSRAPADHEGSGTPSPDTSAPGRIPWGVVVVAGVVSVAALAFSNGLPFDVAGTRAHFEHILGVGHTGFREFEPGFRGQFHLFAESLLHLKDGMGGLLLVLSLVGVVVALVFRPRVALLTLVPAASYYALFIGSIGYVYLRFTLPVLIMLAIVAASTLDLMAKAKWLRPAVVFLAVVIIGERGYSTARMVSMMDMDPRTEAEAWLEREAPTARIAAIVEIPVHNIEFPLGSEIRYIDITTTNPGYGDNPPDLVVSSVFDPPRKLVPAPVAVELPSVRLFARDYDRVATFAPEREHPVRQGISFQPSIAIYQLRPRPEREEAPGDADGSPDGSPEGSGSGGQR